MRKLMNVNWNINNVKKKNRKEEKFDECGIWEIVLRVEVEEINIYVKIEKKFNECKFGEI
jgi:hypothetical protein